MPSQKVVTDRRKFLAVCSALGLSSTLFPGVFLGMAEPKEESIEITRELITRAARVAAVPIAEDDQDLMFDGLRRQVKSYEEIHKLQLANNLAPALLFDPVLPGMKLNTVRKPMRMSVALPSKTPKNLEDVAFYSVRELAELVRSWMECRGRDFNQCCHPERGANARVEGPPGLQWEEMLLKGILSNSQSS